MKAAFLPGFLWLPGDDEALRAACAAHGVALDVLPLTALAEEVTDIDRELVPALGRRTRGCDVVVGYSMGARVLLAALSRGLSTPAAVLVSLSTTPATPAAREARAALDAERATQLRADAAGFVDAWGALPLFAPARSRPAWQEQQRRRRSLSPADAWGHARTLERFSSSTLTTSSTSTASTTLVPVTLLAGALDSAACTLADATARALPHARVVVIANAGHVLPLEAPTPMAAAVASALVEATSPPGPLSSFVERGNVATTPALPGSSRGSERPAAAAADDDGERRANAPAAPGSFAGVRTPKKARGLSGGRGQTSP